MRVSARGDRRLARHTLTAGPAVREVVRSSAAADYRFSAMIVAIVKSTPFQMRNSP
jgi:hypothetical protein